MVNAEKELKRIGQKVKKLRKEKGYKSLDTFAYEHNLSRVQYWRIENGENITIKTLITVLNIHNLTLEEFFKL